MAENRTHDTWRNLRNELQILHLGVFRGPAGESHQRTDVTSRQAEILKAIDAPEPPRFLALRVAPCSAA